MTRRITVAFRGIEYRVDLRDTPDPNGDTAGAGKAWQVTRDGALLTTFPYDRAENEAAVRAKVLDWLRAQPMGDDVRRHEVERGLREVDPDRGAGLVAEPPRTP
jgi:hypothetical protein